MTKSRLPSKPASSLGFAIVVSGLTVAGVVAWLVGDFHASVLLALALVGLGAFSLATGASSGRMGPMMLTFWPFVMVTMGIAPLVQFQFDVFPKVDPGLGDYYDDALLLTLVVSLAYSIGYATRARRRDTSVDEGAPASAEVEVPILNKAGSRQLALATGLALAAFPVAMVTGVGIASRFQTRDELLAAYSQAGFEYVQGQSVTFAILKTMPTVFAIVGTALAVHELTRRQRARLPRINAAAATVICAGSFVVFANPLSNTRYLAFSGLLAVVFSVLRLRTWRFRFAVAAALVVGLTAIYPASAMFKSEAIAAKRLGGVQAFTTVDFDGMQQTAAAITYVEARGRTDGRVTLSGMFFAVPRAIWENKSLPSSYLTTESRGYAARNLSQPLWSEFYLDFGWLGAPLLFLLFGRGSAAIDSLYRRRKGDPWVVVIAAAAAVQIGFLRGPMGAQVVIAAPIVAVTAVAVWAILRGKARDAIRPSPLTGYRGRPRPLHPPAEAESPAAASISSVTPVPAMPYVDRLQ